MGGAGIWARINIAKETIDLGFPSIPKGNHRR